MQKMRYLNHRPGVLFAIDEESIAELGFAVWRRLRIQRSIKISDLGGGAVSDFIEFVVVEIGRDCR